MIDYALWEVIENGATLPKTQLWKGASKACESLELLGEKISQEDVNQKLLRCLSREWNTHAGLWRNKANLDTMSMDDLYHNLKVYEQKLKELSSSSSRRTEHGFCVLFKNNTSRTNGASLYYSDIILAHGVLLLASKCKALRNQDNKNKESLTKSVHVETSTSIALLSCDGLGGYDWSDQAKKGPNYALMAFSSDSEVSNDYICSKSCLETVELLKSQNDQLLKDLKKYVLMVLGEITIRELRKKLETVQKEKDDIQLNVDKFEHASKSLNKLIKCQIVDNCKKGLGYENYNAVPSPYTGNFMPSTLNLSFTSLEEFVNEPVVENSKAMSSKEEPKVVRKNDDAPIIKEWVSNDEEEDVSQPKIEKKTVRPSIAKKEFVKSKYQEKTSRKTIKQVDCNYHQKQFQNQRMVKPVGTLAQRVNHQNFAKKTRPCAKKNMVPRAVLMKSGLVSINTASQNISKTAVLVNTTRQVNTSHSKTTLNAARPMSYLSETAHSTDKGVIDSGCSRHMTGNMSYLTDYEEIDGGYVAFGGNPKGGKITGKGTIKTGNLDFENVYFVRELKFNLFSISQMCDKKNSVLFNDTECIVLSPNFKLIDESQVLLRVPRKNNMYSVDLKNIVPKRGLTCLFVKATSDESKLWHRRLGHLNFKTMNKLVKGNLVRGLPSKLFENDQTCVACQKGKQHRASCKSKTENSISLPLHLLHMDLFGLTFVKSLMKKMYCLVVIDDYSRFTWVFFLATKDETSGILKSFITGIENLVDHKVKVIRCDNGTEFKNREMNQFCEMKGILRQFSVARTPQQNGVAERRNRTLIEAARTMLADSKLPTTFWAEAVNTACYVQNRVLVVKPHNKTPYELFHGRTPTLSFMRPFGCPVTILNTIDHLGKFDGKADEGFFVGYSLNSKAFRVFNSRTRIVEENLHIRFSESTPNVVGSGPDWLFDIDVVTTGNFLEL
ncbi:putative ribonuclease H-like domain-containing protein [Tanacetum coccineum]